MGARADDISMGPIHFDNSMEAMWISQYGGYRGWQ